MRLRKSSVCTATNIPGHGNLNPVAGASRELNSLHYFLARVTPKELRRLTEGAQESFTHPSAIDKTRLPRDDINRVMALLYHQPRGFKTEFLKVLVGLVRRCIAEETPID
jgi:hypothetical protein